MYHFRTVIRLLARLVCVAAVISAIHVALVTLAPAAAQTPAETGNALSTLEPFLEKARNSGATVIVIEPGRAKPADQTAMEASAEYYSEMVEIRNGVGDLLAGSGVFLSKIGQTLSAVDPKGSTLWILHGIAIALLGSAVGYFAAMRIDKWTRGYFAQVYRVDLQTRTEKLSYLLLRSVMMLIGVIIFVVIAALIVLALDLGSSPVRVTASAVVFGIAGVFVAHIVLFNILAPDAPGHRMIHMSDRDSKRLHRSAVGVFILGSVLIGLISWMEQLGLDRNTYKLALIGGTLIAAVALSIVVVSYRRPVAMAILGDHVLEQIPIWRRVLAATWQTLAIVYFAIAWVVSSVRLILDLPDSTGLVGGPLVVMVLAFAAYALALVIIDKLFKRRKALRDHLIGQKVEQARAIAAERSADQQETETGAGSPSGDEAGDDAAAMPDKPPSLADKQVFRHLIEHGATILIVFGGLIMLLDLWGLDFAAEDHPITRSLDLLIVGFVAYMCYQAVKVWIDSKIEDEEPQTPDGEHADSDPTMGHGATRIATLLPIFRNFLLITIISISGMIILSGMGVDIGPLFAGAGVVGLAVGFGAQALIRDIFSGAFFLIDDAFRRGEYINLGSIQGVVEKISIRSFQLRHHNGPLHTVPFGEIKQLTNFSRDWVIMKLKLRVTYDTDVERLRKLIKKFGQKLQADPEYGHMFLEPLKSQGVVQMDDSAMIVRVKFMTKPGDQFLVRRLVYTGIRDLFDREGIAFAHRQVTVRIADQDKPLSEKEKLAVAGAVRPVLDGAGMDFGDEEDGR
jgi:small-conductance mechanosensitive channel